MLSYVIKTNNDTLIKSLNDDAINSENLLHMYANIKQNVNELKTYIIYIFKFSLGNGFQS